MIQVLVLTLFRSENAFFGFKILLYNIQKALIFIFSFRNHWILTDFITNERINDRKMEKESERIQNAHTPNEIKFHKISD